MFLDRVLNGESFKRLLRTPCERNVSALYGMLCFTYLRSAEHVYNQTGHAAAETAAHPRPVPHIKLNKVELL